MIMFVTGSTTAATATVSNIAPVTSQITSAIGGAVSSVNALSGASPSTILAGPGGGLLGLTDLAGLIVGLVKVGPLPAPSDGFALIETSSLSRTLSPLS